MYLKCLENEYKQNKLLESKEINVNKHLQINLLLKIIGG